MSLVLLEKPLAPSCGIRVTCSPYSTQSMPSSSSASTKVCLPEALNSFLKALPSATPKTVAPRLMVEAYFQLVEGGHEEEAVRVLAHLVTEKNDYLKTVRYLAGKWKNSGHAGFEEDDLVQGTLERIIQGLRNQQRSALNWCAFCSARFQDAKGARELNGYRGGRAKIDKQLRRFGGGDAGLDDSDDGGDTTGSVSPPRTPQVHLEPELLEMFSGPDLRQQVEDDDLEAWGNRVVEGLFCSLDLEDPDAAYVAREVFRAESRRLTGAPDEAGLRSVADERGWANQRARYLKKKARAYLATELLRLLDKATLGAGAEIERAWLRTWFNRHELS